jgi:hypothetical protein
VSRDHRRWALVAVLTVLALGGATADAAAQCGQDYRGAPAQSTPGGPPLAIGDSVLADAVPLLVRDGFEADGMVCRQMSQGLTLLRSRARSLPHLVVLALGTNGPVTPAEVEEALAILGPKRILVLVTPHGSVDPSTPRVIRAAAAAHSGEILLLDWDRLAAAHPEWLAPDGVHLGGQAGIEGFAQMVAGVFSYASSGSPTEATPPEAAPPSTIGAPITIQPPPAHRKLPPSHPPAAPPSTTTAVPALPTAGVPGPGASAEAIAAAHALPGGSEGSTATLPIVLGALLGALLGGGAVRRMRRR